MIMYSFLSYKYKVVKLLKYELGCDTVPFSAIKMD